MYSDIADMKVIVVLACRSESTRLYGKPLQLVGNKPIIEHIYERIQQASMVDNTVVAAADTPSKSSYADFARKHNLPFVVGSEEDVLQRLIDAADCVDADVVVRAMTENPFIYWNGIDDGISTHIEEDADLTVMRKLPAGTFVDIHSVDGLKRSHRQGADRHRSEYTTRYINENPSEFTIAKTVPPEDIQRPEIRLTVDNPEDLVLVREIYDRLPHDQTEPASLADIVSVVENDPSLLEINNQYSNGTDQDAQNTRPFVFGDSDET
jgi:spore coat polysaccharide biosynthesis protein SpsF